MQRFTLHSNDANRSTVLANAQRFLAALPASKSWRVEVSQYVKTRSNDQCRYLNGVVYATIGAALGFDRDDISEYLCGQFFGWKVKPLPGGRSDEVPVRTTTTDADGKRSVLSVEEFAEYVEFCQRFAAENGIFVPDPESDFHGSARGMRQAVYPSARGS